MRKSLVFVAATLLGGAAAAQAADLPTSKPAPPPPAPTLAACADPVQFFTTPCPLSWYGITIYGTIDAGIVYQDNGTPFNKDAPFGRQYLVGKTNNKAQFGIAPNGLSQSFIGVKASEPLAPGWSFVFNWQMGFDPYSLQLANGPKSQADNDGLPPTLQSTNGDSSRAGQWYNGALYAGLSSTTFGTLTVGRQNSLTLDGVNAYDPMGGSYAFSLIGFSGATAGVGDTEDTRYSTALKYRVDLGQFRVAALYDFGGYAWNNAATSAWQVQAGVDIPAGDYGKFSFDAIYSQVNDAVATSVLNPAQNAANPGTLAATISDDKSIMLLAKYTLGPLKLYGGYENIFFGPPSNPQGPFTTIADIVATNVNNTKFTNNQEVLQVMWTGAKYAINDKLDVTGAYYHEIQDNFNSTPCSNKSSGTCAGTLDAISLVVDWRFAPKFDVYAGLMYSQVSGGLASGFTHTNTVDPMAGLRFQF